MKKLGVVFIVLVAMSLLAAQAQAGAMFVKFFGASGQASCEGDDCRAQMFGGGSVGVGIPDFLTMEIGGYMNSNGVPGRVYGGIHSFPIPLGKELRLGGGVNIDYDPSSCEETDPYLASLGECTGKTTIRPEVGLNWTFGYSGDIIKFVDGKQRHYPQSFMTLQVVGGRQVLPGDVQSYYIGLNFNLVFQH